MFTRGYPKWPCARYIKHQGCFLLDVPLSPLDTGDERRNLADDGDFFDHKWAVWQDGGQNRKEWGTS